MLGRRSSGASSCGELIAALHTFDQSSEPPAHSALPAPPMHLKVRSGFLFVSSGHHDLGLVNLLMGCCHIRANVFNSWWHLVDKISQPIQSLQGKDLVSDREALFVELSHNSSSNGLRRPAFPLVTKEPESICDVILKPKIELALSKLPEPSLQTKCMSDSSW